MAETDKASDDEVATNEDLVEQLCVGFTDYSVSMGRTPLMEDALEKDSEIKELYQAILSRMVSPARPKTIRVKFRDLQPHEQWLNHKGRRLVKMTWSHSIFIDDGDPPKWTNHIIDLFAVVDKIVE